ncbi:hypothetical protein EDB80DRAFT_874773 [Ilyonectria destructans]|nr:hypothetical protein EDB80DRAFT_874773 [Ilyonectria destructans]
MISQLCNYMPSGAYHDNPRSLASAAFAPALVTPTITLTVAFMASIVTTAVSVSPVAAPVILAPALAVIQAVTIKAADTAEGADRAARTDYYSYIRNPRRSLCCCTG